MVSNEQVFKSYHSWEPQHEIYLLQFAFVARFVLLLQCGDRTAIEQISNTGAAALKRFICGGPIREERSASGVRGDPESDHSAFGRVVAQREVGTRRLDALAPVLWQELWRHRCGTSCGAGSDP